MTDRTSTQAPRPRRWLRISALIGGVIVASSITAVLIAQRVSDGPLNAILAGGPLRAGRLVSDRVIAWPAVLGNRGSCVDGICGPIAIVELQLVEPPRSRFVGIMLRDGQLYVPCDLGFMWGRFSGRERSMLHLMYVFKRWHEDALRDGRVVLRIDGRRYEQQAVRVADPELLAALRLQLEEMARAWVSPEPLPEAPTERPNDIWFFRVEPRPVM